MPNKNQRLVNKLMKFPILGKFFAELKINISQYGIVEGLQRIRDKQNTKHTIVCQTATRNILEKYGVLIAFNHPYEIETFAIISSLPNRDDIKIIASANTYYLIEKSKHIIPVWIDHKAKSEKKSKLSGKIAKIFSLRPDIDPDIAHQKNIQSIEQASLNVQNGGITLIAPEGFRGLGGKWFSGIGYLISDINNLNTYYVSCYIENTSELDWLRLFPFMGHILPKLTIHFNAPQQIKDIINKYHSPKEIARGLENEYLDWINNIKKI